MTWLNLGLNHFHIWPAVLCVIGAEHYERIKKKITHTFCVKNLFFFNVICFLVVVVCLWVLKLQSINIEIIEKKNNCNNIIKRSNKKSSLCIN